MERVTSKTMDAYVEFVSLEEAMKAVDKHHHNLKSGRVSRLGDRPIEVELSSQANLMRDLFPLARGLIWDGATPHFKPFNQNYAWENFRGFVSEEEMVMLIKHVEVPHRVSLRRDMLAGTLLTVLVAVFQGLPPASLRVLDQHTQEVPVVRDRPHHRQSAPCHVHCYGATAPGPLRKGQPRL